MPRSRTCLRDVGLVILVVGCDNGLTPLPLIASLESVFMDRLLTFRWGLRFRGRLRVGLTFWR